MKRWLVIAAWLWVQLAYGQTNGEIAWLNQRRIPLQTTDPEAGSEDLKAFLDQVGESTVVALGECTHGSREIFRTKHRLWKALVEQKGFTIFAIEADYTGAQAVNEYIQTGRGDSTKVIQALAYWTWQTEEVWALIQWMRVYNQTHATKLTFPGFDMNVPFAALEAIRQSAEGQPELKAWTIALDTLYRRPGFGAYADLKLASQLSQKIGQQLNQRPPSATLLQSARTLVQYAEMRSRGFLRGSGFRDQCMAENVEWIRQQSPGAKVVLWAHNGHIETRGGLSRSMGYFLRRVYGTGYLPVGFLTGRGRCTAISRDSLNHLGSLNRGNELIEPTATSFEHWFMQASVPDFYLDLRGIPTGQPNARWLTEKKDTRNIGSMMPLKPAYQFTPNHRLVDLYDILIFLRETSASRCYGVQ